MIKEINNLKELQEIITNNDLVLVDFYATWCGPCKMLSPVLDELSKENSNVIFAKVNVDENLEAAKEYEVNSIPHVLFFKNKKQINQFNGFKPKQEIEKIIKGN